MNRFAALFAALDGTTKTGAKTAALADYFRHAPDADRVWTVALLTGRRPKRAVNATELRLWAAETAGIPDWLFEESYTVVGDLADPVFAYSYWPEQRAAAGIQHYETMRNAR